MKYKALILDLDGTTVPARRDGMPSEKVKQAVRQAAKHVKVCVATGRPIYLAEHIFKELGVNNLCVTDGGAEIYDPLSGRLVFKRYIPADDQVKIWEICRRFDVPLFTSETQYDKPIGDPSELKQEVAKLFIDAAPKELAIKLVEEMEAVEGVAPHFAGSWRPGDVVDIHITQAEATKKHGVEKLMKLLELNPAEVVGVGDNHNDLPMLSAVGLKVVVGNAPDEVKAAADYVAPPVEDEGVADVIQKFILTT
jgi:HAD superfamily hydrolase (TIGR01484 family)